MNLKEELKELCKDLSLQLNYVCYDPIMIEKLVSVWQALETLEDKVNSINIPEHEDFCNAKHKHLLTTGNCHMRIDCEECIEIWNHAQKGFYND